jgi:hypothetical protein
MIRLKVLLHEMNWKEAKQCFAENDLAILPVGTINSKNPSTNNDPARTTPPTHKPASLSSKTEKSKHMQFY